MYLFDEFELSPDVLSSGTSVGRLSTCDASWCSLSIIRSIRIVYIYIYIYIYINLPDMSQLPTSPFPKRGTSGPGNVFSTLC